MGKGGACIATSVRAGMLLSTSMEPLPLILLLAKNSDLSNIMPEKKLGTVTMRLPVTSRRWRRTHGSRGAMSEMRLPAMSRLRSASRQPTGLMSRTLCPSEMTSVSRKGKRASWSMTRMGYLVFALHISSVASFSVPLAGITSRTPASVTYMLRRGFFMVGCDGADTLANGGCRRGNGG